VSPEVGAKLGCTGAPAGTATWKRLSPAMMFVAVIAAGLGIGLGSRVAPHGSRDVLALVIALLGLGGDVLSPGWLWVGRGGSVVIAAALVVIVRTARRATVSSTSGVRPLGAELRLRRVVGDTPPAADPARERRVSGGCR
jgi:hypothetical protein